MGVVIKTGYVYILVNSSYPDLVKIGKTTKHPEYRAKELNQTGVPTSFVVAYHEHVVDCDVLESQMHEELDPFRANERREFFRLPCAQAIQLLMQKAEGSRSAESFTDSSLVCDSDEGSFYIWQLLSARRDFEMPIDLLDNPIAREKHAIKPSGWDSEDKPYCIQAYGSRTLYRFGFTSLAERELGDALTEWFQPKFQVWPQKYFFLKGCHTDALASVMPRYEDDIVSRAEQLIFIDDVGLKQFAADVRNASMEIDRRYANDLEILALESRRVSLSKRI